MTFRPRIAAAGLSLCGLLTLSGLVAPAAAQYVTTVPATLSLAVPAQADLDSATIAADAADLAAFRQRQYRVVKAHKRLAYTTGGLLLAADGVGLYHFLQMRHDGHVIRDQAGGEDNITDAQTTSGTQEVWQSSTSQTGRVIHGGLIAAATVCYTATATMELAMPRMSRSTSKFSNTKLHKYTFLVHAIGMAANIALGYAESEALSAGNHDLVQGLGAAHLVVGFALPIVMVGSGLIFKVPNEY